MWIVTWELCCTATNYKRVHNGCTSRIENRATLVRCFQFDMSGYPGTFQFPGECL